MKLIRASSATQRAKGISPTQIKIFMSQNAKQSTF